MTRKSLDRFLRKYATEGKTLDLGCSGGPYAAYFPHRIGVDIRKTPQVDVVADAHDLHMFKDGEFDCILCTEVLEHLHTPERAIAEMRRVLKRGGTLILTTRFIFPLHDTPHDYYRYTKYGLRHLFRDFKIIELLEEAGTIKTLAVLHQRLAFQCETLWLKPFRLSWLLLAKITSLFSFLITAEYGDVYSKRKEKDILASGYYLVAKKR